MTKEQVRAETDRILSEFFDGYLIVGRIAGQPQFVFTYHIPDFPTKAAISELTAAALQQLRKDSRQVRKNC